MAPDLLNGKRMNTLPKIFSFTDYREYLRQYYEWNKEHQPNFSYASFAEKAGLQSRSYLRLIISGKRNLSPEAIPRFIKGVGLANGEAEAFVALVHFNQSTNFEARSMYWNQFIALIPKQNPQQVLADEYSFLSRSINPALLNILRQKDIKKDFESLMKVTGLTKSQLNESLDTLRKLNLIKEISPEQFVATEIIYKTTNDIPSIALQTFHRTLLEKATAALSLPVQQREFQAVTFALSEEEFLYIRKRLRDLAEELDKTFARGRTNTKKIYTLNMNLIPVTNSFIQEKSLSQKSETDHKKGLEV